MPARFLQDGSRVRFSARTQVPHSESLQSWCCFKHVQTGLFYIFTATSEFPTHNACSWLLFSEKNSTSYIFQAGISLTFYAHALLEICVHQENFTVDTVNEMITTALTRWEKSITRAALHCFLSEIIERLWICFQGAKEWCAGVDHRGWPSPEKHCWWPGDHGLSQLEQQSGPHGGLCAQIQASVGWYLYPLRRHVSGQASHQQGEKRYRTSKCDITCSSVLGTFTSVLGAESWEKNNCLCILRLWRESKFCGENPKCWDFLTKLFQFTGRWDEPITARLPGGWTGRTSDAEAREAAARDGRGETTREAREGARRIAVTGTVRHVSCRSAKYENKYDLVEICSPLSKVANNIPVQTVNGVWPVHDLNTEGFCAQGEGITMEIWLRFSIHW